MFFIGNQSILYDPLFGEPVIYYRISIEEEIIDVKPNNGGIITKWQSYWNEDKMIDFWLQDTLSETKILIQSKIKTNIPIIKKNRKEITFNKPSTILRQYLEANGLEIGRSTDLSKDNRTTKEG